MAGSDEDERIHGVLKDWFENRCPLSLCKEV